MLCLLCCVCLYATWLSLRALRIFNVNTLFLFISHSYTSVVAISALIYANFITFIYKCILILKICILPADFIAFIIYVCALLGRTPARFVAYWCSCILARLPRLSLVYRFRYSCVCDIYTCLIYFCILHACCYRCQCKHIYCTTVVIISINVSCNHFWCFLF